MIRTILVRIYEGVSVIDTSRPASRILAMLELLQNRPGLTGQELADRLDVTSRTVRRYATTLQDMGIPVETNAGRKGGYALVQGFRVPPLMFSADEALGLAMALLNTTAFGTVPEPVARALEKIERVLPKDLADRIELIRTEVDFSHQPSWYQQQFPQPMVLATLAQARLGKQRVWIRYGSSHGDETAREVDPYGIGYVNGRWYLHAYCHLRRDRRTFRVDRIRRIDLLPTTFVKPEGLDIIRAIQESLAMSWQEWQVEVIVHAPLAELADEIPNHTALLEEIAPDRTRLRGTTSNLRWYACRILLLPYHMEIVQPPELREEARQHAARLTHIAESG